MSQATLSAYIEAVERLRLVTREYLTVSAHFATLPIEHSRYCLDCKAQELQAAHTLVELRVREHNNSESN